MRLFIIYLAIIVASFARASDDSPERKAAADLMIKIGYDYQMRLAKDRDTYHLFGLLTTAYGSKSSPDFMFISADECIKYRDARRILHGSKTLTFDCVQREDTRPKMKMIGN